MGGRSRQPLDSIEGEAGSAERASVHANDEEQRRVRARWAYIGFAIGVLIGIVQNAVLFAFMGWRIFPAIALLGFLYWPAYTALLAYQRAPGRRAGKLSWRWPRFGMRTLML